MMSVTTWFKIGTVTLTVAASSLLVRLDFPAHMGILAGMMVFLAGMAFLFCYELYTRMYADIYQKYLTQKNLITSGLRKLDLLQRVFASLETNVSLLLEQEKEALQKTERGLANTVSMVALLTKMVECMEVIQKQQGEGLSRLGGVSTQGVSLAELLTKMMGDMEIFSQKEQDAIVQLQEAFERAAKRDLEAKEKLVEIAGRMD